MRLATTDFLTVSVVLPLPRMLYSWNQTVCSLFRLVFFTKNMSLSFPVSFCGLIAHFFLLLNNSNSIVWMHQFVYLSKDILVASGFWELRSCYKYLFVALRGRTFLSKLCL